MINKIFFKLCVYAYVIVNLSSLGWASENPFFEASCLWSPSLNFKFNGNIVEDRYGNLTSAHNENWHTTKAELIKNANAILGIPNVAIAQLKIIYNNPQEKNYYSQNFDLPYYFVSGWDENNLGHRAYEKINRLKVLNSQYYPEVLFIKTSNSYVQDRVEYAKHLLSIYKDNQGKFSHVSKIENIRNKTYELERYLKPLQQPSSCDECMEFGNRFYHSEQALFLNLKSKKHFLKLVRDIPDESIIHQCVLNISSYYDMCLDCGDTGFRQVEAIRGFSSQFEKILFDQELSHKGFNLGQDECKKSFIIVSGQTRHKVPSCKWESRPAGINTPIIYNAKYENEFNQLKNYAMIDDDLIETKIFPPYVAQKPIFKI